MKTKYRYLIPNSITFISLTCGLVSILLSAIGDLPLAAGLILASYILDLFDGAAARYFDAGTEFGLQLDSLVDMVSLGTAPAVLAFMYLYLNDLAPLIFVWPLVIFFALAGAFRLARFNLLPPKTSGRSDSAGLTISTGGATLALAVWSNMTMLTMPLPMAWFLPTLAVIGLLMISHIPFPSFTGIFSGRLKVGVLLVLFAVSLILASLAQAWFFWNNIYLGFALLKAGYRQWA